MKKIQVTIFREKNIEDFTDSYFSFFIIHF